MSTVGDNGDSFGLMQVGAWFSGRWRTDPWLDYVRDVRRIRRERTWRQTLFAED